MFVPIENEVFHDHNKYVDMREISRMGGSVLNVLKEVAVKKSVDHLGNEYKSLAEMLRTYKISKSQYGYRQKKGWDIERILTTQSDKCHVYDHNGVEYSSTKAMCERYDIPYDTFLKRIGKYNMPLEKALTKRVKNREMLAPNGTAYKSKAKMCNAYGISVRTYNSRVNKLNWDCQKALETKVKHISRGPYYDHTGQGFRTMKEMCEKWKISVSTYTNKINLGYSVKDALTLHTENYQTSFPEHVIYYYCRKVYSDALIRKKLQLGVETEIDIYLPSLGIGIEHDCAIFHTKDKDAIKYQRCRKHNIFLVRISDDVEAKEGVTCDKLIKYIPQRNKKEL